MKSPQWSSARSRFLFGFLTAGLLCCSVVGSKLQTLGFACGLQSRDLVLQADGGAPPPPPPPIPGIPKPSQTSALLG